jgi:thiamine-phosphate pyrophosphorylase
MTAGEDGADYLMFGEPAPDGYTQPVAETIERLDWWSQIFEAPCVGYAPALSDVAALCAAGADFVALGEAIWADARGPAAAIAEAQAQLKARGPDA